MGLMGNGESEGFRTDFHAGYSFTFATGMFILPSKLQDRRGGEDGMQEPIEPKKTAWGACLALASAALAVAFLWTGTLLILFPSRIPDLKTLVGILRLDLVPVLIHALALAVTCLAARGAWARVGLGAIIGAGLVLVPWAMRTPLADQPPSSWSAALPGLAFTSIARALATAQLPIGDVLSGRSDGLRRLAALTASVAAASAASSLLDSGLRFLPSEWSLTLLREAPFIWAWMSVPPPEKQSRVG